MTIAVKDVAPDHPEVLWHGCDNYGFGNFVLRNYPTLARLGYGRHFGEWFGQGIQRGYGLDTKMFALFRVPPGVDLTNFPLGNVTQVPVLGVYETFDTEQLANHLADLQINGSVMVRGWHAPEGIVAYHARSGQLFKYTVEAGPKGQKEEG
jgi:hypothetical protein